MYEMPSHDRCPFCDYLNGTTPCPFVTRNDEVSVFVNRAQYETGAVLLVTNRHIESIFDLDAQLLTAVHLEVQRISRALFTAFEASGVSIFQNVGTKAGQTVSHLHIHVVPRYGHTQPRQEVQRRYPPPALAELYELADKLVNALPK